MSKQRWRFGKANIFKTDNACRKLDKSKDWWQINYKEALSLKNQDIYGIFGINKANLKQLHKCPYIPADSSMGRGVTASIIVFSILSISDLLRSRRYYTGLLLFCKNCGLQWFNAAKKHVRETPDSCVMYIGIQWDLCIIYK